MRGGRSLLFLLVVALGLGAYIYFVEMHRDPSSTETKAKLFTLEAGAIEEIEIKIPTSTTTTIKKSGDTWAVIAPVSAAGDEAATSGIASALASIEIDRVLDENPASLTQFGLDVPNVTVSFKSTGNPAVQRLLLGSKTPTGSGLYARVDGQTRLLLIPAHLEDTLKKSTFELRDKRILAFERDRVDAVTLTRRGTPAVSLAQKNGDWTLTAPIAARADFSPADGLVGRLAQAQMTSIVSEGTEPSAADLKTFGLDTPEIVASVGVGSARSTIAIGGKKDDTAVYARDLSRAIIFTVDPTLVTDLTKTADDLRVKNVFEFAAFSAVGLDLTHGATSVSYGKTKPSGGDPAAMDVWAQTKPAAKEVNQTAMTDLMNTLSSLRVDRFVALAPVSGTDLVVVARWGDGVPPKEERVTLRKSGDTAYAISAGEPGAGVIPTADFDKALAQLQTITSAK